MRHTFTAELAWGGDIQTGEAEVTVTFSVAWGRPTQGWAYSHGGIPADPDEIVNVEIITVDGKAWGPAIDPYSYGEQTLAEAADTLTEKLIEENFDAMLELAGEEEFANEKD